MEENKQEQLPDVQNGMPDHLLAIDRVGVSGVSFPLTLRRKDGGEVVVDATLSMFGSLVKDIKGTNMSRMVETLMAWADKPLSGPNFEELLKEMRTNLESADAYLSADFKYYLPKLSPVTQLKMWASYKCRFVGVFKTDYRFYQEVAVPVTSLCPCSKTMSLVDTKRGIGKGGHSQKGVITLQVKCLPNSIWLEDLIELCQTSGSAEIYSLLKRPDEKYVTEKAYENPKFVEDIVRTVAAKAMELKGVSWFRSKVENFESIHDHSATCYLERTKVGTKKWVASYKGLI